MPRKSVDDAPSNGAELAKLLNITLPQCYNLANSGTIPKADNGTWNLAQCANAYIKYLQGRAGEEKRAYAEERTRLTKAQADKTELELQILRAGVIQASVVQTVWGRMTSAARARLLAMPYRIAHAALSANTFQEIEAAATALIAEALDELHEYSPDDYVPRLAGDAGGLAVETAASADRQPVGRRRKAAQPGIQRGTGPVEH